MSSPKWKLDGMMKAPSFHGAIQTREAERRLKEYGSDCYLTRYSNDYKLSVMRRGRWRRQYKHFIINITRVDYSIEGKAKKFDSISSLLEFYQRHSIRSDIPSIGNGLVCLDSVSVPVEVT